MEPRPESRTRLAYLDGLRGIAILLVFLFHSYTRHPEFVPYGKLYGEFFFAKHGWLGVQLFFMVSGYVIYMTLQKCSAYLEFLRRRWLRLFPAMLIVTILLVCITPFYHGRPYHAPVPSAVIPGLLFLDPAIISKIFGVHLTQMEGSFWSLYVEVKFYILFGGLFYLFGAKWAKIGLAFAFVVSNATLLVIRFLGDDLPYIAHINKLLNGYLSLSYSGWFLAGVLTFELQRKKNALKICAAAAVGILASAMTAIGRLERPGTFEFSVYLVILFIGAALWSFPQKLLSAKFLLFIGFISYPFYLFHERFTISVIVRAGEAFPALPAFLLPVIPFCLICAITFAIARYGEPVLRTYLNKNLRLPAIKGSMHQG